MDGMKRKLLAGLLIAVVVPQLLCAQEDDAQARRAAAIEAERRAIAERAAAEAERRRRELDMERMREFQRDSRIDIQRAVDHSALQRELEKRAQSERLQKAFHEFALASEDFRQALGFKTSVKTPANKVGKNTSVFLGLMEAFNKKRQKLDTSEFNGMTESELGWEAITTAERIQPQLEAIVTSDSETTVDVKFLESFSSLEKELLRLQWMVRRLK